MKTERYPGTRIPKTHHITRLKYGFLVRVTREKKLFSETFEDCMYRSLKECFADAVERRDRLIRGLGPVRLKRPFFNDNGVLPVKYLSYREDPGPAVLVSVPDLLKGPQQRRIPVDRDQIRLGAYKTAYMLYFLCQKNGIEDCPSPQVIRRKIEPVLRQLVAR